jgi:hypothetical protein
VCIRIPVFPDGDYYGHMTADLAWGTFGNPRQQTLTICVDELVATLGTDGRGAPATPAVRQDSRRRRCRHPSPSDKRASNLNAKPSWKPSNNG